MLLVVGVFDVFVRKKINLPTSTHAILASKTRGFNEVLIGTKGRLYWLGWHELASGSVEKRETSGIFCGAMLSAPLEKSRL